MPYAPVRPMLAAAGPLPAGPGWAYELKWDGVRALAEITDGVLRLYARSGNEITAAYPEFADLRSRLPDALLDGEVVVFDGSGRPSFTRLAERMHVREAGRARRLAAAAPATYLVFDVLRLYGVDMTRRPYAERRATLDRLSLEGERWLVPPSFTDGPATLAAARENGLEGVVAKRLDGLYRPGVREWVKVKLDTSDEFLVGGWRPGARRLGALLIGEPGPGGALHYRGRVGGGISGASERALLTRLAPLVRATSPFTDDVPRPDSRDATWVEPVVVVEVTYGARTPDGRLRFPRLKRLRPDKSAGEVPGG